MEHSVNTLTPQSIEGGGAIVAEGTMEPAERDQLVFRLQDTVAHVAALRKHIRQKLRSRMLRPKLLLHCVTFLLVGAYLQELISNTEAIHSNQSVLKFLTSTSFSQTEVSRSDNYGNETTTFVTHFGELNDKEKVQRWIRDGLLQELLIDSTPMYPYTDADKKAAEEVASDPASDITDESAAASTAETTVNQSSTNTKRIIVARQIKHRNFRLLFGVRLRQLRVVPFDRNSDNEIIRKACLVSRLSRETFYDIDWAQNEFGERTYGWLTSKCYPEWRNDLESVYDIEAGPGRFASGMNDAAAAAYNFTYYNPPAERSVAQEAKFSTYPNRGWVVDFALDESDPLGRFDENVKDRFIDEQTRAIIVEFTVFLGHDPAGTYSNVRVVFELHPSGGMATSPIVTSAELGGLSGISLTRVACGVLLTLINLYNIAHGLKQLLLSISGGLGEFTIYAWDVLEVANEVLMMSLVVDLWSEIFYEEHRKWMLEGSLSESGEFFDTAYILHSRREGTQVFAANAFLVSIRFAQFFKLSDELKLAWVGVSKSAPPKSPTYFSPPLTALLWFIV